MLLRSFHNFRKVYKIFLKASQRILNNVMLGVRLFLGTTFLEHDLFEVRLGFRYDLFGIRAFWEACLLQSKDWKKKGRRRRRTPINAGKLLPIVGG